MRVRGEEVNIKRHLNGVAKYISVEFIHNIPLTAMNGVKRSF